MRKKPKTKIKTAQIIGANIKRYRLAAGMTQAQLASAMGYKEAKASAGASICRAEAGTQQPRLETLAAIANALEVQVSDLLAPPANVAK